MNIVYSKHFLEHSLGASHPERPERLEVILKYLTGNLDFELIEPSPATENELLLVHSKEHLDSLEKFSKTRASFPDNVFSENTYCIAKLAAGAAFNAASLCSDGFAYAHVRPPGHHAGKGFFAGFCYINNMAFAVRKMQKQKKAKKVLIVDFDIHHGNGTFDIFKDDPSVYYLSFNQDPYTTYPGSGFESEGNEHMVNVVLQRGATENEYIQLFESNLSEAFDKHKPDLIGVSAGFDTYALDHLASGLRIFNTSTYNELGNAIARYDTPTFATLEGGYYLPDLGKMVYEFLSAFKK